MILTEQKRKSLEKLSDKELFKSMGEKARKLADGIYSEKDILEKYKNEI